MPTLYDELDQSVQLKRREKMAKAEKIVGTVKAKSQYGIKIEGHDDWLNWSKEEYRIEPFTKMVEKGNRVELVVDGKYIIGSKVIHGNGPAVFGEEEFQDSHEKMESGPERNDFADKGSDATGSPIWSYEQKDKLSLKQTCINAATAILVAQINAGMQANPVLPDHLHAYADQLESLCWETFRG